MSNVPALRIPEEQVAAILARAAELDRETRESFDLDAIRTAALEAGISRAAVDRALDEYVADGTGFEVAPVVEPEDARREGRFRRLRRRLRRMAAPVLYGLTALGIGVFVGGADEEALYFVAFLGWLVFAGVQVWRRRPSGRARGFLAIIALMTVGGMMGLGAANGDEDALIATMFAGVALMGYGTLYIKLRLGSLLQRAKRLADRVAGATPAT